MTCWSRFWSADGRGGRPNTADPTFRHCYWFSVNRKYFIISCICAPKQYVDFRSIRDCPPAGRSDVRVNCRGRLTGVQLYSTTAVLYTPAITPVACPNVTIMVTLGQSPQTENRLKKLIKIWRALHEYVNFVHDSEKQYRSLSACWNPSVQYNTAVLSIACSTAV